MKGLLISILTICASFFITLFLLNSFHTTTEFATNVTENENNLDVINQEENKELGITNSSSLDFSDILTSYDTWKEYNTENIDLSTDFIPVDTEGNEISKKYFLEKLITGYYIPVKLPDTTTYMYQLYKIDNNHQRISKSIKSLSNITYKYYLKEGELFPEFSFNDLNGNSFSKEEALGNILVIKCWFLQCRTCIEEFPVINDLYDRYEGHDDVIFLSLTFDKPDKLREFLAKKEFRYPVVAEQKDFIKNEIGIIQYPAHIIIDKQGNIHKIVNNVDSLILALDTIADEDTSEVDM